MEFSGKENSCVKKRKKKKDGGIKKRHKPQEGQFYSTLQCRVVQDNWDYTFAIPAN